MSKRLRASIRAGNRGRTLRPKGSRPYATEPEPQHLDDDVSEEALAAPAEPPKVQEARPPEAEPKEQEPPKTSRSPELAAPPAAALDEALHAALATTQISASGPVVVADAPSAPSSTKRSHHHAEEAPDSSSVSAEFFKGDDEDSVPPLVDAMGDGHDDRLPVAELSPAALARRARLRRLVGGVVAFAGVVVLAAVGKTLIFSKPSQMGAAAPPPRQEVAATLPAAPAPEPKPAPEAKPPAPPVTAAPEAAPVEATPPAEPKAEEKAPDPAEAVKLQKLALDNLNRGKIKDAIEAARASIAADPTEALPYLYLGSALQDSGKWKEGIEAYSECVRTAKKGPVHECSAMGGRK